MLTLFEVGVAMIYGVKASEKFQAGQWPVSLRNKPNALNWGITRVTPGFIAAAATVVRLY